MSRIVERLARVVTDPDGAPCWIDGWPVLLVHERFREWIGALEGESERDIWRVETARGVLELHHLHDPIPMPGEVESPRGSWILARVED